MISTYVSTIFPYTKRGGEFVTGVPSQGGAPAAPSKRTSSSGGRPVGLKAKHGDKLFTLDPNSSIIILKLLEEYEWPQDGINDIGLTLEDDLPRLGVLTIRHLNLAMNLNYYVQRQLKDYRWSTIAIDRREHVYQDSIGPTHKTSALLTMGCYTEGTVYTTDGDLQITADKADTAFAIDRPYASVPPQGAPVCHRTPQRQPLYQDAPRRLKTLKVHRL